MPISGTRGLYYEPVPPVASSEGSKPSAIVSKSMRGSGSLIPVLPSSAPDTKSLDPERARLIEPREAEQREPFGYQLLSSKEEIKKTVVIHTGSAAPSVCLSEMPKGRQESIRSFVADQVIALITSDAFRLGLQETYGKDNVDRLLGIGTTDFVVVEMRENSVFITRNGQTSEFTPENFGSYAQIIRTRLKEGIAQLQARLTDKEPEVTGISVTGEFDGPVTTLAVAGSLLTPFQTADALAMALQEAKNSAADISKKPELAINWDEDSRILNERARKILIAAKNSYAQFPLQQLSEYYQKQLDTLKREFRNSCERAAQVQTKASFIHEASQRLEKVQWMLRDADNQCPALERRIAISAPEKMGRKVAAFPQMAFSYAERVYETLLWLSLLEQSKQKAPMEGVAVFNIREKAEGIVKAFNERCPTSSNEQKTEMKELQEKITVLYQFIQTKNPF